MWMFGILSSSALEVVVVMPQLGPARLEHRQHPTGEWFHLPCHHSREMTSRLVAMRLCGPGIALQMLRFSMAALSDMH